MNIKAFRKRTQLLVGSTLIALPIWATAEVNPYAQPDDSWITLNGTIQSVSSDSFLLDYGDGAVTVEMDDGDRDADGYKLVTGDEVSVSGKVDDDFFETTTIEASSVYVKGIDTYFYASAADEEAGAFTMDLPVMITGSILRGVVTEVNGDEFVLNTGKQKITVDVDEMAYNPLDDKGYQKIKKGDLVLVTGYVDNEFFDGRVFDAKTITTLINS